MLENIQAVLHFNVILRILIHFSLPSLGIKVIEFIIIVLDVLLSGRRYRELPLISFNFIHLIPIATLAD